MDWCHGMRDYCCFDRLNMDPVDYQIIVGWIRASGLKRMPTLGRRSYIDVSYEPGGHLLVTGRNGARKSITVDFWNAVCARIEALPEDEKERAGRYADRDWNNPNYFFAPSVPAICRYYQEHHQ